MEKCGIVYVGNYANTNKIPQNREKNHIIKEKFLIFGRNVIKKG